MTPVADRVAARRHTVIIVLRLLALALIITGAIMLLYGLLVLGISGTPRHGLIRTPMYVHLLARAGACLLPGAGLMLLDQRIARWVVPMPRPECPRCRYRLHDRPPRCPECGLDLGA